MKHEIELDAENQWIVVRFRGVLEEGDPRAVMERAVKMPGWTPRCDRIVVYADDADLHKLDVASFSRMRDGLAEFMAQHYGDAFTRSAQVCSDRMKQVVLDFWVNLTADGYPAELQLFHTVNEAKAWLLSQRTEG